MPIFLQCFRIKDGVKQPLKRYIYDPTHHGRWRVTRSEYLNYYCIQLLPGPPILLFHHLFSLSPFLLSVHEAAFFGEMTARGLYSQRYKVAYTVGSTVHFQGANINFGVFFIQKKLLR